MARAKAGSGFLLTRTLPKKRYVLTCLRCGFAFEKDDELLGQVQREHFMRMHDTAKVEFRLLDRWKNEERVLN